MLIKININNINKLYIGNLPYTATDEALKEHFSQVGAVASVSIIKDKFSGRSRGFGFVEMSNAEEVSKAIETLDGQEYEGRNLKVNLSTPKE